MPPPIRTAATEPLCLNSVSLLYYDFLTILDIDTLLGGLAAELATIEGVPVACAAGSGLDNLHDGSRIIATADARQRDELDLIRSTGLIRVMDISLEGAHVAVVADEDTALSIAVASSPDSGKQASVSRWRQRPHEVLSWER